MGDGKSSVGSFLSRWVVGGSEPDNPVCKYDAESLGIERLRDEREMRDENDAILLT